MNSRPLVATPVVAFSLFALAVPCFADPPGDQAAAANDRAGSSAATGSDKDEAASEAKWIALKSKWVACEFGGDGPVEIKDDRIEIGLGDPLTGVRWEGDVFRENYEIELEARRTEGFDFFCGLTFPVGKDHVSFILGGWGGGVVGISSIDDRDASDNLTTSFRNFENGKWYKVRVRVEPNEIRCWIDDKAAAEHQREGHKFDIRYEMDQTVPLGVAAYQCDAEYRNLRMRKLTEQEIEAAKKKSDDGS